MTSDSLEAVRLSAAYLNDHSLLRASYLHDGYQNSDIARLIELKLYGKMLIYETPISMPIEKML